MNKIYTKPCLVIESFATEEVMNQQNVLSSIHTGDGFEGMTINFDASNNNIVGGVNGINYEQFKN